MSQNLDNLKKELDKLFQKYDKRFSFIEMFVDKQRERLNKKLLKKEQNEEVKSMMNIKFEPYQGPPREFKNDFSDASEVIHKKILSGQAYYKIWGLIKPIPNIGDNQKKIAYSSFNKIISESKKFKALPQSKTGFMAYAKFIFKVNEVDFISFVLKDEEITVENIMVELKKLEDKAFNSEDYIIDFIQLNIVFTPLDRKGGCLESDNHKYTSETIVRNGHQKHKKPDKIIIKSYRSKNNNCLIACFNHHYNIKGNEIKPAKVRKDLNIPENEKIDVSLIPEMSEYYNKLTKKNNGYMVLNQKQEIIMTDNICNNNEYIKIFLRDEHYYLFECVNFNKCQKCGVKLKENNTTHKCNLKVESYMRNKIMGVKDMVAIKNLECEKLDYKKVVHWDIETFQETNNHLCYASGYTIKKKYVQYYGKESLEKTIDDFVKMKDVIINAYNGSGFDFYFLLNELSNRNVEVTNLILNNGRLMGFQFGKNVKVFDLCLFSLCSLETACEDFKLNFRKSQFDHKKIKCWDDVEKYRNEVEPYLNLDVMVLKELFQVFNDMIYQISKVNISRFVSAGNMAYEIWASMLKEHVEIPNEMNENNEPEKYYFIRKATYGGRCYPMRKEWKSKHYNDVVNGKMSYEELMKSSQFIYNADATSLYPASMKGFKLVKVAYPIGPSRWSNHPNKHFKNNKIGFYEIDFVPPTNIRVPILPRRKLLNGQNVGCEWSLFPGSGVYTSVDIENAINNGYQVTFKNKCLIWDKQGDLFSEYIDLFYSLKETAEKENNDVKRNVAKLMLNALYGKTLQQARFNTHQIVNNIFQFNRFQKEFKIKDFVLLGDSKLLISGEAINKQAKITKPCQLGAFVTAYSRRIMLTYIKEIDPTLTKCSFTYTDTDSLHIFGDAYHNLKEKGYIKDKANSELGFLCSDIKNEGIIIWEKNLAPKTYNYEYIDNKTKSSYINKYGDKAKENYIKDNTKNEKDNEKLQNKINIYSTQWEQDLVGLHIKEESKYKCKGIPKKELNHEYYQKEQPKKVDFDSLKKKHAKLTKSDVEIGLNHFSIVNVIQKRTFLKNEWQGMQFYNGEWYPLNFDLQTINN